MFTDLIKRAIWAWRNRCRKARMTSADLPTAALAQSYLTWLHRHYAPCRVCGTCWCRHARNRANPIELTYEQQEQKRRQLRLLGANENVIRAAFE